MIDPHALVSAHMRAVVATGQMPDGPAKQLAGKALGRSYHVRRAFEAGDITLARTHAEHVLAELRAMRKIAS